MSRSFGEIRATRQHDVFVGRDEQIASFADNLRLDESHRSFIVNIAGQGGTGKTFLARRFRSLADDAGYRTAWVDHEEHDVVAVMERVAIQADADDRYFQKLSQLVKRYRKNRHELESDPTAPASVAAFIGSAAGRLGYALGSQVPGVGMAVTLADQDVVVSAMEDAAAFVARKLSNRSDIDLVRRPIPVMSEAFVEALDGLTRHAPLCLVFDTFEYTSSFLERWLLDLLDEKYGLLGANWMMVIAGQEPLDSTTWRDLTNLTMMIELDAFNEGEATLLTERLGVAHPAVAHEIIRLSDGLPVLIATLASAQPTEVESIPDPGEAAVSVFLRWIADPSERELALDGALPRILNDDVVATLREDHGTRAVFERIRNRPFVSRESDGWTYHRVVRSQLLRVKRTEAPVAWRRLHQRLERFYKRELRGLGLRATERLSNERWQRLELERLYHRLSARPQAGARHAVNQFPLALAAGIPFAHRWALTAQQAGKDAEAASLSEWSARLTNIISAYGADEFGEAAQGLQTIIDSKLLHRRNTAWIHHWRHRMLRLAGREVDSELDVEAAVSLAPELVGPWLDRGSVRIAQRRFEEAIADYDMALERSARNGIALFNKAWTLRRLGRQAEAVDVLTVAVEANPSHARALIARAGNRRELGDLALAQDDLERALALKDDAHHQHEGLKELGLVFAERGWRSRAIETIQASLEYQPGCFDCWERLGLLYSQEHTQERVASCLLSTTVFGMDGKACIGRALALAALGCCTESRHELAEAFKDEPERLPSQWNNAGLLASQRGHYECALILFEATLEHERADPFALYNRAVALARRDGPAAAEVAIQEATRAVEEAESPLVHTYGLAGLAAVTKAVDSALDGLGDAVALGADAREWASSDPAWIDLRAHPTFIEIIGVTLRQP